ncbi:hypothetical protein [Arenimonas donghaensis]|nr:hypothetical protein [Arenimonas donghaensis]
MSRTAPADPMRVGTVVDAPRLPPELDDLRIRAESGDHVAGCRLGARLVYCGSVVEATSERVIQFHRDIEERASQAGDLEKANRAAESLLRSVELARHCQGLPERPDLLGYHYLRQAALGGNADAIILHASGSSLGTSMRHGWDFLRDGRFDQWRSEAPAMLQKQIEKGDPAAVLALVKAYNDSTMLAWILPPDPDRAYALDRLAEMLIDPPGHAPSLDMRSLPTRAQFAGARETAREWHATYFGGRKYASGPQLQRLVPPARDWRDEGPASDTCTGAESWP